MSRDNGGPSSGSTTRISKDLVRELAAPKERAFLIVYHRNGARLVPLKAGAPVVIGRDDDVDVTVVETNVSRRHAKFVLQEGKITVEDLGSTNGTEVDGKRVTRAELSSASEVSLGGVRVSVHTSDRRSARIDGLASHDRFSATVEQEVERARVFERGLALLRVRAARPGAHVSRFAARVRALLRAVDQVGIWSGDALEIVCPELALERALELARELSAPAPDGVRLLVGISLFPSSGSDAEALIEASGRAAERADDANPVQVADSVLWQPEEPAPRSGAGADPVIASAGLRKVFQEVALLGKVSLPVLLHGETGTGKEVVARAIHEHSARRGRRMLVVNCGAIPSQLVESTLFGHVKGSFTGATQDQKGVFEAADGGTVFLDEIGELSLAAQAALLRVLDTSRVTRVGSTREIKVDVRVIAATHRSLESMCDTGAFRDDLFYRLNGTILTIPPLRDRPEDIEPLVQRFLFEANEASGYRVKGFSKPALSLMIAYRWPGNVRELRNAVQRAVAIAQGDSILEEDLPERLLRASAARAAVTTGEVTKADLARAPSPPPAAPEPARPILLRGGLKATLKEIEVSLILDALDRAGGNQTEAAKLLVLPLRTLAHKIKTLGIIKKRGFGVG